MGSGGLTLLPMMNSDQKTASSQNRPQQDERNWKQLSDNILTLALEKSERMIDEDCVDDAAFDRDARDLRLLMSSAEIAARMNRQNEKDRRPNDEQTRQREHTEEELDDIFRRVTARVDGLAAGERARRKDAVPADQGRDAGGDSERRRETGMADQCA